MSNNQGYYDQSQGDQQLPSTNPWSQQTGNTPSYNSNPQQQQQQYAAYAPPGGPPPQQQSQSQYGSYAPPTGPPPGQQQPKRSATFKESDFVPESERGEQREAIEHFEMTKGGNESQQDRDVAQVGAEPTTHAQYAD
jgi:hypothetical protein